MEDIVGGDCRQAIRVYKIVILKNKGEYHDVYVQSHNFC